MCVCVNVWCFSDIGKIICGIWHSCWETRLGGGWETSETNFRTKVWKNLMCILHVWTHVLTRDNNFISVDLLRISYP